MNELRAFLARVPAVKVISDSTSRGGSTQAPRWWLKLSIDITHPLAWRVVQELAHVLNYLSLQEPLATVFMPVSPPPYMNGGPRSFLSWVIENTDDAMTPGLVAKWLEGRLPRPVDDVAKWTLSDDDPAPPAGEARRRARPRRSR